MTASSLSPSAQQPRIEVAILSRAPIAGQAKTRLIPVLGAAGAARLHAWLMQRAVATAVAADVGPVSLWCDGDLAHPAFVACHRHGDVALRQQPQGDLGWRMLTAIRAATTPAGVLVIGTDCPALTPQTLQEAAVALTEYDSVVIPAEDGGYVLIGMKTAASELFAKIDWGTDDVMAQTRSQLCELGWRWHEATTLWDIDRPADLIRLQQMFPQLRELRVLGVLTV